MGPGIRNTHCIMCPCNYNVAKVTFNNGTMRFYKLKTNDKPRHVSVTIKWKSILNRGTMRL